MHRIAAPIRTLTVVSADGSPIHVTIAGKGPHHWLLPPGMGTPVLCWKYLFEYFQDKMTIATWDPRGCYGSPRPDDINRIEVADHVADGLAILRELGWDKEPFMLGGWSMGIELSLELYSIMPDMVKGLVLINGAFEHVLKTAFNIPYAEKILGGALVAFAGAAGVFNPFSKWALTQSWSTPLLRRLGLVSANEDFFIEVLGEFKNLDFGPYFLMIAALSRHSARALLPTVRVPTLITAGDQDQMTPPSVSEEMLRLIPDSELFIIPRGTHYTTMEFPEIVNLKLEQFFRRRVFKEEW